MARLNPTVETKRALYLLSGNLCAFPGCNHRMIDENHNFIGEICHIQAANEGGERFNPNQTDEERRNISNLILLCPTHHKITDDVNQFTVDILQVMKRNHENQFLHAQKDIGYLPDNYLNSITIYPKNLFAITEVNEYYNDYFSDVLKFIQSFEFVSTQARQYYAHCLINTGVNDSSLLFDPRIVDRRLGIESNDSVSLYKELEIKNLLHEWDSDNYPYTVIGSFAYGNFKYKNNDNIGYFLEEIQNLPKKTILDVFENLNFSHLESN